MEDLVVNEAVVIPARELSWTATASGGPGGQHVNKVATKVFLRWDLGQSQTLATSLPSWVDARLRSLAARRINGEGILEVSCDATRSQSRNLEIARARLVDVAWLGEHVGARLLGAVVLLALALAPPRVERERPEAAGEQSGEEQVLHRRSTATRDAARCRPGSASG